VTGGGVTRLTGVPVYEMGKLLLCMQQTQDPLGSSCGKNNVAAAAASSIREFRFSTRFYKTL
jgi:hypothetical protein